MAGRLFFYEIIINDRLELLREILSGVPGIQLKSFSFAPRDDNRYWVSSETDLGPVLAEHGFKFTVKDHDVIEGARL